MSKRKATGAQVSKRRSNFTGAEVEVMLQGVELKRGILFSSVNEGYKPSQKTRLGTTLPGRLTWCQGRGAHRLKSKKEMGRCEIGGQKKNSQG